MILSNPSVVDELGYVIQYSQFFSILFLYLLNLGTNEYNDLSGYISMKSPPFLYIIGLSISIISPFSKSLYDLILDLL